MPKYYFNEITWEGEVEDIQAQQNFICLNRGFSNEAIISHGFFYFQS